MSSQAFIWRHVLCRGDMSLVMSQTQENVVSARVSKRHDIWRHVATCLYVGVSFFMSCVAATCLFWRNPPTSLCLADMSATCRRHSQLSRDSHSWGIRRYDFTMNRGDWAIPEPYIRMPKLCPGFFLRCHHHRRLLLRQCPQEGRKSHLNFPTSYVIYTLSTAPRPQAS